MITTAFIWFGRAIWAAAAVFIAVGFRTSDDELVAAGAVAGLGIAAICEIGDRLGIPPEEDPR